MEENLPGGCQGGLLGEEEPRGLQRFFGCSACIRQYEQNTLSSSARSYIPNLSKLKPQ